ncbi:hypothetical protein WJX72_005736 [[Myrmecia] bisecta]|uniref:Thioesterase domain-containing protein n=1 Tax=[Myrmecia] bisecta TaxID=41462 RepID=A0AAW1QRS6_9CHLO
MATSNGSKWILPDTSPGLPPCDDRAQLPPSIQVMPVELPGRNSRMRDPKHTSMRALVDSCLQPEDGILPLLREKPYALFGHSMGAWVAYELAQEMQQRGEPLPLALYASANRAPHLASQDVDATQLHSLPSAAFWPAFERRYGHNPSLPRLPITPLSCPITAIGGTKDTRYTPAQLGAWTLHTSRRFDEVWVQGSHRFLLEPAGRKQLLDHLARHLPDLLLPTAPACGADDELAAPVHCKGMA